MNLQKTILILLGCFVLVLIGTYKLNINKEEPVIPDPTATSTPDVPTRVMSSVEVAIPIYKTATTSMATIRLNDVPQDYRCPSDVQCIQAGAIVADVTMTVGDKTLTRPFPSDEVPFVFEGIAFSIVDIAPALLSTKKVNKDEYVVTFKIAPTLQGDNM